MHDKGRKPYFNIRCMFLYTRGCQWTDNDIEMNHTQVTQNV